MAGKKQAKMGHSKVKETHTEVSSHLVMITRKGCRVSKAIQPKSDCGLPRIGWHYGSEKDVTCLNCLEGNMATPEYTSSLD
jgi:hypothetical protein